MSIESMMNLRRLGSLCLSGVGSRPYRLSPRRQMVCNGPVEVFAIDPTWELLDAATLWLGGF